MCGVVVDVVVGKYIGVVVSGMIVSGAVVAGGNVVVHAALVSPVTDATDGDSRQPENIYIAATPITIVNTLLENVFIIIAPSSYTKG